MSRIDYDTDITKHYVRYDGWLDAVRYREKRIRKALSDGRRSQPLSYFTFCASSAIDVFMLEREKLLGRDKKSGRLEHVYYCEMEEREFQHIANLIGSAEAGFMERFEDFVLFEDDAHTRGKKSLDPKKAVPDEKSIRRKFANKALHEKFLALFPFDVINLDLYGNVFPPKGEVFSPMLKTIDRVFEWQGRRATHDDHQCETFTLFLTVYVHKEDIHKGVLEQLTATAQDNMTHEALASAFREKYPHGKPDNLMKEDFPVFFSIIFPKILAHVARGHGWFGKHRKIYIYNRPTVGNYHMMSSVICYDRMNRVAYLPGPSGDRAFLGLYIPEIASIFRFKPANVNTILSAGGTLLNTIGADLRSIVEFRQKVLAELSQ